MEALRNYSASETAGNLSEFMLDVLNIDVPRDAAVQHDYKPGSAEAFAQSYIPYHGYISAVLCSFGLISNIMNATVLSQRRMRTAVNSILIALAISDGLLMSVHLVFVIYFYIETEMIRPQGHTYGWVIFMLLHHFCAMTSRQASIGLVIALGVFRCIAVTLSTDLVKHVTIGRAKVTIFTVVTIAVVLSVPVYLSFRVVAAPNVTEGYYLTWSELAEEWHLYQVNIWSNAIVIRLAVCVTMIALSIALIWTLRKAQKRHNALLYQIVNNNRPLSPGTRRLTRIPTAHPGKRVTLMLLTILLIFILTEAPHSIILFSCYALGQEHFRNVYMQLREVFDLLVIIQCTVNFWLYCGTSSQFRSAFKDMFVPGLEFLHANHADQENQEQIEL